MPDLWSGYVREVGASEILKTAGAEGIARSESQNKTDLRAPEHLLIYCSSQQGVDLLLFSIVLLYCPNDLVTACSQHAHSMITA